MGEGVSGGSLIIGGIKRHHFLSPFGASLYVRFLWSATRQNAPLVAAGLTQQKLNSFWSDDGHVQYQRRLYGIEDHVHVEQRIVLSPGQDEQRQIDHHDHEQFGKHVETAGEIKNDNLYINNGLL